MIGAQTKQALTDDFFFQRFAVHNLVLEHGFFTASSNMEDVWLISNGTCMPRNVEMLPEECRVRFSDQVIL